MNAFITNWSLLGPLPLGRIDNELSHNSGFETDFLTQNGGETNPCASLEVIKLKRGNWLMVYSDVDDGRYSLTVAISK